MHHGKRGTKTTAGMDDSARHRFDKQPRVVAADLGFHAPDYIVDAIIMVADPRLIYSNVHAQRDRRLRLLIRRYTNQIQYGCRNVNCPFKWCWSYRKRNGTAPLKRYTELSARTLAVQLVDDFRLHGKDPALGLCPHEPDVPWYEDPAHTKKRRNSSGNLNSYRQENGHLQKLGSSPQRSKGSPKGSLTREHILRRPSQDRVVEAGRRLRQLDTPSAQRLPDSIEILNTTLSQANRERKEAAVEAANEEPLQPPTQPSKPKDLASFTQTLYDLLPLRLLDWLPNRNSADMADGSGPLDHAPNQDQLSIATVPEQRTRNKNDSDAVQEQSLSNQESEARIVQLEPTYSLQRLTMTNMAWLLSKDGDCVDGDARRLTTLIRQSFFYCLSDPARLVKTVKDVQESAREEYDATDRTRASRPAQAMSATLEPSIARKSASDMKALLYGLSYLENFGERDLVMTSVLMALQHLYILPPWLHRARCSRHSRSGSGSSDKAMSKRQQASENAGVGGSSDSNSLALDLLLETSEPKTHLDDAETTELCLAVVLVLGVTIFNPWPPTAARASRWLDKRTFIRFIDERNRGQAQATFPGIPREQNLTWMRAVIDAIDVFDDPRVFDLLAVFMDVISHRIAVTKRASSSWATSRTRSVVELLVNRFDRDCLTMGAQKSSWIGTATLELARTTMLTSWNHSAIIERTGPVGGALELLAALFSQRRELNLDYRLFWMPFIADKFTDLSMPSDWLSFRADNQRMHILSFAFLFQPQVLVTYFRAININIMKKSFEEASVVFNDARLAVWPTNPYSIPVYGTEEVLARLRPHMAKYFVLTIRRDNILDDAMDQIWRRQRIEMMRPLRVRIGKDEGEDGLDHGGVQQEFFRLLFAAVFNPDYGMFTTDATTRMAWFQPGSFEPLYRFEALGILMSIAIYNGLTLPLTMPLAFYRKVLGLNVRKLDHITDGWPDLARSLRTLLEWSDGDVGDVIARTYEFSYELCGTKVTVDMQKVGRNDPWPTTKVKTSKKGKEKSTSFELPLEAALTPPSQPSPNLMPSVPNAPTLSRTSSIEVKGISTPVSIDSDMLENNTTEEAALVTNDNRGQYVKDYILWLTHKSIEPQYEAFARGLYVCLDRTSLSLFTAEALKTLVEGYTDIDINELEKTATYEEYTAEDPTIIDFWDVVRNMSSNQHKQLLEFVTASDRVPVNGLKSVTFLIQRHGEDDTRLPGSSTCYGRLLLPQYSSKEIMKEKLTKAIENSVGFGQL